MKWEGKGMFNCTWKQKLIPWLIPFFILGFWQIFSMNGLFPATILPSPFAVIQTGVKLTASGELINHISISLGRAFIGFIIGGILGFFFGLMNGLCKPMNLLLQPTIRILRSIPHISLLPLVISWFGMNEVSFVFLVTLGILFPIYIHTYQGIKSIDKRLIEMGRAYGLKGYTLIFHVIFPGALSSIFVGIRYALGMMWMTLIVVETVPANSGIGYLTMNAREFMQIDMILLSILIYSLLGKLSVWMAKLFEKKWLLGKQLSQEGE
jgi:sulfonate transport system permease protein